VTEKERNCVEYISG